MAHSIFISLTHQDTAIAEALREALRELFGDFLQVHFSTSKELAGGIKSGEDWFQWIVERVKECNFSLILITPSSLNKPWILWEAGAVAGAALASEKAGLRKVRPLVYQIATDQIPSPIRDSKAQFRRGDQLDDLKSLLREILNDYRNELSGDRVSEFGEKINEVLKAYLAKVQAALLNAPAVASPAVLEEWRLRLDEIMNQNRPSEVAQLHDWMDVAFGRGAKDRPQPLDLRIHSRLADLYLKAGKQDRAIEQLDLARQLAPRDIYVLRTLGRAYLQKEDREQAKVIIDRIAELDGNAFVRNAECAALLGRWYRSGRNPAKAAEVYEAALDANPNSYYLANLVAEVLLEAGRNKEAGDAFRRALDIIEKLTETNIWTHASAANAAFFLGEDERAVLHLKAAAGKKELDTDSRASIERGLNGLAARIPDGSVRLQKVLANFRA
jgi:tetratricopeptide (TPR) repeat protein